MTEQEAYDKGYKQGYADRIEMERALRVDDCISREDATNKVAEILERVFVENIDIAEKAMGSLPSVKPKNGTQIDYDSGYAQGYNNGYTHAKSIYDKSTRAKGKWVDNKTRKKLCNCSECGGLSKVYFNYCPKCGCDMRGEVQE